MIPNCSVDIKQFSGEQTKTQAITDELVNACIAPASNDILALYDIPSGQGFSFIIQDIDTLKPESKLIIKIDAGCGLDANTELTVVGRPTVNNMISKTFIGTAIINN